MNAQIIIKGVIFINRFSKSSTEIFHNTKVKEYPDGGYKVTCADKKVFKESGWESASSAEKVSKPKDMTNETRSDSLHRTIEQIHDIIRCNCFDYYVTLTLNAKFVDRKSPKDVYKKARVILSNLVQRYGVSYLLIPELHKDGAIHFHGFMKGNLILKDSGTVRTPRGDFVKVETAKRYKIPFELCRTAYNLPQWTLGLNNAIRISGDNIFPDEYIAMSKYITKYITKEIQKIFGSAYLSGGNLIRKAPTFLTDLDYNALEAQYECYCAPTDTNYKYYDSTNYRPNYIPEEVFDDICTVV